MLPQCGGHAPAPQNLRAESGVYSAESSEGRWGQLAKLVSKYNQEVEVLNKRLKGDHAYGQLRPLDLATIKIERTNSDAIWDIDNLMSTSDCGIFDAVRVGIDSTFRLQRCVEEKEQLLLDGKRVCSWLTRQIPVLLEFHMPLKATNQNIEVMLIHRYKIMCSMLRAHDGILSETQQADPRRLKTCIEEGLDQIDLAYEEEMAEVEPAEEEEMDDEEYEAPIDDDADLEEIGEALMLRLGFLSVEESESADLEDDESADLEDGALGMSGDGDDGEEQDGFLDKDGHGWRWWIVNSHFLVGETPAYKIFIKWR